MHGRVEARRCRFALNPTEDHGIVSHRAADEAALAGEGGRRTLTHDPKVPLTVALAPGKVVMVVHGVEDLPADDRAYLFDHPLAPGIGILAGEGHGGEVLPSEVGILMQHDRRNIDAVLATGELDEGGRGLVTEPARTKVHADPYEALLVVEQVHVVVA